MTTPSHTIAAANTTITVVKGEAGQIFTRARQSNSVAATLKAKRSTTRGFDEIKPVGPATNVLGWNLVQLPATSHTQEVELAATFHPAIAESETFAVRRWSLGFLKTVAGCCQLELSLPPPPRVRRKHILSGVVWQEESEKCHVIVSGWVGHL